MYLHIQISEKSNKKMHKSAAVIRDEEDEGIGVFLAVWTKIFLKLVI